MDHAVSYVADRGVAEHESSDETFPKNGRLPSPMTTGASHERRNGVPGCGLPEHAEVQVGAAGVITT